MSESGLRRRDEILQVMYWLHGEGLAATVEVADLRKFLAADAGPFIAADLQALVLAGLVQEAAPGGFQLTAVGLKEGGRRFEEEFHELTGIGHGGCSDPDCDCHVHGPESCTTRIN